MAKKEVDIGTLVNDALRIAKKHDTTISLATELANKNSYKFKSPIRIQRLLEGHERFGEIEDEMGVDWNLVDKKAVELAVEHRKFSSLARAVVRELRKECPALHETTAAKRFRGTEIRKKIEPKLSQRK